MHADDDELRDVVLRMRRHRRRELIARWGGVAIALGLSAIGLAVWYGALASGPRSSAVGYLIFFASCAAGAVFYRTYEPKRAFEEDEGATSAPDARSVSEPARPGEPQVPAASVLGTVAGMADPLGFEHTTFESGSAPSGNTCAACATGLVGDYWTANGAMVWGDAPSRRASDHRRRGRSSAC